MTKEPRNATIAAQAFRHLEAGTGAITPSWQPSTTFARDAEHQLPGEFIYARYDSPTNRQAELLLAELDKGADARLFSSGLAAVSALIGSVPPGGHVVAPVAMYHGTRDLLYRQQAQGRIQLSLIDQASREARVDALARDNTDLLYVETPANPNWDLVAIDDAAADAHAVGAKLAVDSTCAPPCTCRPIEHGADIVVHSATKFLNGHSDVTAGVLITNEIDDRWRAIDLARRFDGSVLGTFEAWMLIRGLRTLFVRFERQSANALEIANSFQTHPRVEDVRYPGLSKHDGHAIAKRQMTNGFGGMLSILIKGDAEASQRVVTRTKIWVPATSLGGVESLIEHRFSVEGPDSPVPPNLLRLSAGIEDVQDLIADLDQALSN